MASRTTRANPAFTMEQRLGEPQFHADPAYTAQGLRLHSYPQAEGAGSGLKGQRLALSVSHEWVLSNLQELI